MTKAKKRAPKRHIFWFRTAQGKKVKAKAKVIQAKREADLVMLADDVKRSMKLKGAADTANCPGALCSTREEGKFNHRVVGYTDWWPSRAFVASRLDSRGMPSECYVYEHNGSVDGLVDASPAGLRSLLKKLQEAGGALAVKLKPVRDHTPGPRANAPSSRSGAIRKRRKSSLRGHEARYARFVAGAFTNKKKAA